MKLILPLLLAALLSAPAFAAGEKPAAAPVPAKPDLAHWVVELQRMVARGLGTPRLMTALEQIGSQELRESPLTKPEVVVPSEGQHVHPR